MRKFKILRSVIFVYLCVSCDRETQRYRTPSDADRQISGSGWQSSHCNSIANLPRKAAVTAGDTGDDNECGNMRWLGVVCVTLTLLRVQGRAEYGSLEGHGPETRGIKTWDNKHFMGLVISYLPPTTMTQIRHWERVKRLNASNYRWLLSWPVSRSETDTVYVRQRSWMLGFYSPLFLVTESKSATEAKITHQWSYLGSIFTPNSLECCLLFHLAVDKNGWFTEKCLPPSSRDGLSRAVPVIGGFVQFNQSKIPPLSS